MTDENNFDNGFGSNILKDNWEWCVLASNYQFIDDIVYKAIAARKNIDILFREHVVLKEGSLSKEYDLLMLNGARVIIDSLEEISDTEDVLFLRVTIDDVIDNPNLLVLFGPDNKILYLNNILKKSDIEFTNLKKFSSSSLVSVNFSFKSHIPNIVMSALNFLLSFDEVTLETHLISIKEKSNFEKVEDIATSNQIFAIDFKNIDFFYKGDNNV